MRYLSLILIVFLISCAEEKKVYLNDIQFEKEVFTDADFEKQEVLQDDEWSDNDTERPEAEAEITNDLDAELYRDADISGDLENVGDTDRVNTVDNEGDEIPDTNNNDSEGLDEIHETNFNPPWYLFVETNMEPYPEKTFEFIDTECVLDRNENYILFKTDNESEDLQIDFYSSPSYVDKSSEIKVFKSTIRFVNPNVIEGSEAYQAIKVEVIERSLSKARFYINIKKNTLYSMGVNKILTSDEHDFYAECAVE